MFRTELLPIIRSLNTVYTAVGVCHTSYVDCLLARCISVVSGPNPSWERIVDVALGRRRSSNLGQESEVVVTYSNNNSSYWRYTVVLLCTSKRITARWGLGRVVISPNECSAVLTAWRLVEKWLDILSAVTWEHTKIMENLGAITTPKFSCFWTLERVWSCLSTVPGHKCALSWAQSRLHESVIKQVCYS
jgi:hypothetical protein